MAARGVRGVLRSDLASRGALLASKCVLCAVCSVCCTWCVQSCAGGAARGAREQQKPVAPQGSTVAPETSTCPSRAPPRRPPAPLSAHFCTPGATWPHTAHSWRPALRSWRLARPDQWPCCPPHREPLASPSRAPRSPQHNFLHTRCHRATHCTQLEASSARLEPREARARDTSPLPSQAPRSPLVSLWFKLACGKPVVEVCKCLAVQASAVVRVPY